MMKDSLIDMEQYVKQTATLINLPISPDYLPGVVDNLSRIREIAELVTELELPETIEAAPIFKP